MKNRSLTLIVVLMVLAVAGLIIGINYWVTSRVKAPIVEQAVTPQPGSPIGNSSLNNIQQGTLDLFKELNISSVPMFTSQQTIDANSLPADLSALVSPNKSSLSAQQAKFEDNKSGFMIEYKVAGLISQNQKFYTEPSLKGWTIVKASSNDSLGLVKLQNDKFDVLVEETVLGPGNVHTVIYAIGK